MARVARRAAGCRMLRAGRAGCTIDAVVNPDRDPELRDAIACSSLRQVPRQLIDRLLEGARRHDVAAGTQTHREGDPPLAELVLAGLIRTFVRGPSGRTMTIRYSGPGALMGIATIFNQGSPGAHGNTTALIDSRLLKLQPELVRSLAEREVQFANALLAETSQRAAEFIDELEAS